MGTKNISRETGLAWSLALALIAFTLLCFWPVCRLGFVNFDDPEYVAGNPNVLQGLTWPGIKWACQTFHTCNWLPLTWLSYMFSCQLFGPGAGPQHVMNLLLHLANVLLLFLVLRRVTGAAWRSAFVAGAFGCHPMHVESVAWIAERKDVLSALFFLLTIWAYAHYAAGQCQNSEASRRYLASRFPPRVLGYYLLSLLFFACGLMSKPMVVTLPFVLLLLDYWPLRRIELKTPCPGLKTLLPVLPEKLPFFALSAADCAVTYWAQKSGDAVWPMRLLPLSMRLENAAIAGATYVGKLIWPGPMAVLYPYPDSIPAWQAAGAAMLLAAVSLAVIWQVRKHPYLAVGWFWFAGMLVPVIGLVQVGAQSLADRYTYLPYIGLLIMLAWGLPSLLPARMSRPVAVAPGGGLTPADPAQLEYPHRLQAALGTGIMIVLAGCLIGTRIQLGYWRDNVTLFGHAVKVTTDNEMAYNMLGVSFLQTQQTERAIPCFQAAVRLHLKSRGRFPYYSYHNLGLAYARQERFDEAIKMFLQAIKLNPNFAPAHYGLGQAFGSKGEMRQCVDELEQAARLTPDNPEMQNKLAEVLAKTGRTNEALRFFEAEVKAKPNEPLPHFILAHLYTTLDRPEEATANLKELIRQAPATAVYLNQLAWIYATHPNAEIRNGAEALRLAELACKLTGRREGGFLDTLSAAYAEAGHFPEAIKTAEEARAIARANDDPEGVRAAAEKLELYKAGQPYHERTNAAVLMPGTAKKGRRTADVRGIAN